MEYRQLTAEEIDSLVRQGCYSRDWTKILVRSGFDPKPIQQVRFVGAVKLGVLGGIIEVAGVTRSSGLFSCQIKNCEIGDDVYFSQVGLIENYVVHENVIIENTSSLVTDGETTFGLGVEVEVLNEGGGRSVPLVDLLSAQVAHLMVRYRHKAEAIANLGQLIQNRVSQRKSDRGRISSGCILKDARVIKNVYLGPSTRVLGAEYLFEGTVASTSEDPSTIGEGVIARKFVVMSGARLESGAMIDKCLIGQGTRMGKQFSGENSLFFANCEAFHGEGVSLFAGPYTISHHKSTLLIAAQLSFYNAGSGTNQSNHMYKLGPLHQGILDRGSKTGSFSYLLWPCRVGAFSVVMDKHGSNFDTSAFPFSYITLEAGKSMLTPAMNLFTVGTRRDSQKWPTRDRRKGTRKLDQISFELLSPFVVGKMIEGSRVLQELSEETPIEQKVVNYRGIGIKRLLLKTCRKYYQIGLKKYFGDQLLERLGRQPFENNSDLTRILSSEGDPPGEWVDLAGMVAPASVVDRMMEQLMSGEFRSLEQVLDRLAQIHHDYHTYAWNWYVETVKSQLNIDLTSANPNDLVTIIEEWRINSKKLNNMILKDAEKEFDSNSKIGFGVDGDEQSTDIDFTAVRGNYANNPFVQSLTSENLEIDQVAENMISRLTKIGG